MIAALGIRESYKKDIEPLQPFLLILARAVLFRLEPRF